MNNPVPLSTDVVLVGGGHTHALALRKLAMQARPAGVRLSLISPSSHTPYSGMLPGLIAGHYAFEDAHIDLSRLCEWAGVRFIAAAVTGLDPSNRRLQIDGRPDIHYDLLSLDIGAQPDMATVPGALEYAVPVKPVASLWARWQDFRRASDNRSARDIAVVGGGAGGVELALALAWVLREQSPAISLYCGGASILAGYNGGARRAVERALASRGVALHCNHRVAEVAADRLVFEQGHSAAASTVFWCTGVQPAPWLAASGLATDAQGFVAVNDSLQSLSEPRIFAAGDVATQVAHPRPKAGVFAVRQAPVLTHNLQCAMRNPKAPRGLRRYRPQGRFLSLVSLGSREAVADRGPLQASGAWVWRWKDHIDRAFMDRFSRLPPRRAMTSAPITTQMPCGGCGAKIGSDPLRAALSALQQRYPRHALPGDSAREDVARLDVSGTLLQSVDSLRALVPDPFVMGQITAAHALSDLYAAGARPHSALAQVMLPYAEADILQHDLEQLLAGALEVFAAADCPLLGGHSLQGPELQLGFAVNGTVPQQGPGSAPWSKRGGQPGDSLILTKALGTGVIFAAQMQLAADGRDLAAATASMLQSNAAASQIGREYGASAATDVTGFGLLGHLAEMLGDSLGAELDLEAVPLLPGAERAAQLGIRSSLWPANYSALQMRLKSARLAEDKRAELLFDPQTSGGLLLALPVARATSCLKALRDAGCDAAIIGGLQPDPAGQIQF